MHDKTAVPTEPIDSEPVRVTLPAYGSFSGFYSEQYAPMVRLAGAILRDPHSAEEATQDAFATLYGKWERVDDPLAYFRRTLVNRCRDQIRRETSRRRLVGRLKGSTQLATPGPSDPMDDAINRLGPDQRAVIVLRYYAGLSPVIDSLREAGVGRDRFRLRELSPGRPIPKGFGGSPTGLIDGANSLGSSESQQRLSCALRIPSVGQIQNLLEG